MQLEELGRLLIYIALAGSTILLVWTFVSGVLEDREMRRPMTHRDIIDWERERPYIWWEYSRHPLNNIPLLPEEREDIEDAGYDPDLPSDVISYNEELDRWQAERYRETWGGE